MFIRMDIYKGSVQIKDIIVIFTFHPLTAPDVRPEYICFWQVMNTIRAGNNDIITPAQIRLYLLPRGPTKVYSDVATVARFFLSCRYILAMYYSL